MMMLLTMGSATAWADSVTFNLANSSQNISAQNGGTLIYTATVSTSGNAAPVFLNGDSFNVSTPITLDDTDFFANFPFTLNTTDSFTGDLFTLNIPAGAAPGTYYGSFSLLGGADGGSSDLLGTVNYSVTVTPEPSSFLLFGTGLSALVGVVRSKRRS